MTTGHHENIKLDIDADKMRVSVDGNLDLDGYMMIRKTIINSQNRVKALTLDCRKLSSLNAVNIGQLIMLRQILGDKDSAVSLHNPAPHLMPTIQKHKLHKFFAVDKEPAK